MDTYRILLLDDEDFTLSALRRELLSKPYVGHEGLEIEMLTSPAAALARAREQDGYFDVVISDNRMPEMSGIDFLNKFNEIRPDAVRILLSGHSEREDLMRAINEAHLDYFIVKPWHDYDLKSALFQALRHHDICRENRRLGRLYLENFGMSHQPQRKADFQLMAVDDDPNVLNALRHELCESPVQGSFGLYRLHVYTFEHPDAALAAAQRQPFDAVVSDYAMPALNGIEFLRQIRDVQPAAARILVSGAADIDILISAVNAAGISHFAGKPWHGYELRNAIDRALLHRELELEKRLLADLVRLKRKH